MENDTDLQSVHIAGFDNQLIPLKCTDAGVEAFPICGTEAIHD